MVQLISLFSLLKALFPWIMKSWSEPLWQYSSKTSSVTVLLESGLFLDLSSVTVLLESGLFLNLSSVTVLLESGLFLNLSSVRPDEGFFIGLWGSLVTRVSPGVVTRDWSLGFGGNTFFFGDMVGYGRPPPAMLVALEAGCILSLLEDLDAGSTIWRYVHTDEVSLKVLVSYEEIVWPFKASMSVM